MLHLGDWPANGNPGIMEYNVNRAHFFKCGVSQVLNGLQVADIADDSLYGGVRRGELSNCPVQGRLFNIG